ncbi:MAG: hypothetical protein ACRDT6_03520 [Micromonosporaceae bacterium]
MVLPETRADQRLYLEAGLRPLACRACGTRVLVKKNSPQHTSVQWLSDPAASCPEFAAADAPSALAAGCGKLRESIHSAVRDGTLEVHDG